MQFLLGIGTGILLWQTVLLVILIKESGDFETIYGANNVNV
jgi:hypothetical protein